MRKALVVMCAALLNVALFASAALAQTTPNGVKEAVLDEATPYFGSLVAIVVALFGAALIVTLARKAAAMAGSKIRKG